MKNFINWFKKDPTSAEDISVDEVANCSSGNSSHRSADLDEQASLHYENGSGGPGAPVGAPATSSLNDF